MTRRYLMASVLGHLFIIILLIVFPWGSKKNDAMETIQVVELGGGSPPQPPVNVTQPLPTKDEAPALPEIKKDEIKIPDKPKVKKVTTKPKPKVEKKPEPKIESKLKDKLSKLLEDEKKPDSKEPITDDVKKNPTDLQDQAVARDQLN